MNSPTLVKTAEMLSSEFMPGDALGADALVSVERLQQLVAERVAYLMDNDYQRLMASLYQMDVDEEGVEAALRLPSRKATAEQLASLIISREMLKARTRAERQFYD